MCGVIGYIGDSAAPQLFYNGLKRLEYRGYDSAGIAVLSNGKPSIIRAEGKLSELHEKLSELPESSQIGIGHTRWATHGKPSVANAHPHSSKKFIVLHNGIIENFKTLKTHLISRGYEFKSETDTEVTAHLLDYEYHKILESNSSPHKKNTDLIQDLEECVKKAILSVVSQVRGTFALAVLCLDTPQTLYAVKFASPLIIGKGASENYIASGITALVDHTKDIIILEDKDIAVIKKNSIEIIDFNGQPQKRSVSTIQWTPDLLEKNGFDHFMLKEIHESSQAVGQTLLNRIDRETGRVDRKSYGVENIDFTEISRVQILACGTSYYAGLLGKQYIEKLACIPVEVDIASEYRYRTCTASENTLIVAISQSGETIDTLQALKHAKDHHAVTLAIVNMPQSTIAHHSDAESLIYAGPEVGVASTKAFTAQLSSLILLALIFSQEHKTLSDNEVSEKTQMLLAVPSLMDSTLQLSSKIKEVSKNFLNSQSMLYMGRGFQWPIAMEGALKLKEISYIHAEGYPSGELKHGPLALIDEDMTVVCLCPRDELYEKNLSNIEEIKARGGKIFAIGMDEDEELKSIAEYLLNIPSADPFIQPFLTTSVVHLLAYWIALNRGHNIDQPRNLAKSVTVE